ncbi:type VII secretion-associated serine protease mycosin [Mycobacterium sp. DSM 3803]|nr:type VII secretion-associated serine protease mycosin [Mycobacterium sp. DSM 3803]
MSGPAYRMLAGLATVGLVATSTLWGAPQAAAIEKPTVDPAALPPDAPPSPLEPMRQGAYCTRVGTLPNTDYRVQPKYMDMLNLPEAWRWGRGAGVKVAVIDTGVSPHPRLPNLIDGGDYVMPADEGGTGLTDCDAHGTWVASLIAAYPLDGKSPLPPARETRRPDSVPTSEAPPPPPPPPPPQTVIVQVPPPAPPAPAEPPPPPPAGPASWQPATTGVRTQVVSNRGVLPLAPGDDAEVPAEPPAEPPPPPPPPAPPADGFSGVAPEVELISIRQSSKAFSPKDAFGNQDPATRRKAGDIKSMARAVRHAADMGAQVINISEVSCMSALNVIDQAELGAALRYAAVERDAVIVAAAGNAGDGGNSDCSQNPPPDPLKPDDPRNWHGVTTVVTPAWFDNYVLTVGAVDSNGNPLTDLSMSGPWVGIAAPGTDVVGLSPRDDGLINASEGRDNKMVAPAGTSFSAAIVSGVAALVRAKYPHLTAHQVINRLINTARPPANGVDNQIGHGIVDPVAALTYTGADGDPVGPESLSSTLELPPPVAPRDMRPVWWSLGSLGAVAALCVITVGLNAIRSRRRQ